MANPSLIIRAVARGNFAGRLLNRTKIGQKIFNKVLTKRYGKEVKLIQDGERFVRKFEKVEGKKRTWSYLDKSYNELMINEFIKKDVGLFDDIESVRTITKNGSCHSVRERIGNKIKTTIWDENGVANVEERKIKRKYKHKEYSYFSTPSTIKTGDRQVITYHERREEVTGFGRDLAWDRYLADQDPNAGNFEILTYYADGSMSREYTSIRPDNY